MPGHELPEAELVFILTYVAVRVNSPASFLCNLRKVLNSFNLNLLICKTKMTNNTSLLECEEGDKRAFGRVCT